jgi:CRISPR/Cas system-associated protein Cas5 (RAMP superfamily)
MFDFTTVATEVITLIQSSLTLITPTTLIGGTVTAAIVGGLMMKFLRGMRRIAR